jgi:hypothetical protein
VKEPAERAASYFSLPIRQILSMLTACILVVSGAWLIHGQVSAVFGVSPWLNGTIIFVFLLGVLTCFWQVFTLIRSVSWIEHFIRGTARADEAPQLLAPLAAQLGGGSARHGISSISSRSMLESVGTRIDEARDVTRYLTNLLVFLGLLGTFYGLATTVPAVVDTIRSLAPQEGESGLSVFSKLMAGLQTQLGGMGTAFSSSLLGLAGSLVVGLLELFAGHGQSRFHRELENWLSSFTRVGLADGESSTQEVMAAVFDDMARQMEGLQALVAQAEANRAKTDARIGQLAGAIDRLANLLEAETGQAASLHRMVEGQDYLIRTLTDAEGGLQSDAESRMRLRSIDVQMLRILEELSAGRQESTADIRADLSALTAAIRQLSRGTTGRG